MRGGPIASLAGGSDWRWRWFGRLASLTLVVSPAVLIARAVAGWGVNVPYSDDWGLVRLLDELSRGEVHVQALWAQVNEHRPVLPVLGMLALAHATDWNIRVSLAANFAVALGILVLLGVLIRRTIGVVAPALAWWTVPAASLIVFSTTKWESWLTEFGLPILMSALGACIAAQAVGGPRSEWSGLVLALVGASVATLSLGNGLVLFALAALGTVLDGSRSAVRYRWVRPVVIGAAGLVIATVYLHGYRYPAYHVSPLLSLANPALVVFVAAYLGAPLAAWDTTVAAVWGGTGLGAFVGCTVWLAIRGDGDRRRLLPWTLLAAYVISSGVVAGVARLEFGLAVALASRYLILSTLFWVSVLAVGGLALVRFLGTPPAASARSLAVVAIVSSLATLAAVSYGVSWRHGEAQAEAFSERLRRGRECVRHYSRAPDACLRLVHPAPALTRDWAGRLERLGLGPFAAGEREPPLSAYRVVSAPGPSGFLDAAVVTPDPQGQPGLEEVVMSGWATDPFSGRPARRVLAVVDGAPVGWATTGLPRPGLAEALGWRGPLSAGWVFRFGRFLLTPGGHRAQAYVVLETRGEIVELGGSPVIDIAPEVAPDSRRR